MRGLAENTKLLISYARALLEADHPQTLRQLHYAIFSRNEIGYQNTQADYKRLSRATTAARRKYRAWELCCAGGPAPADAFPPQWMVDETRNPETVNVWENVSDYIETVKRAYRRDAWQDQENYCEVWAEKGTILGAIRPVAEKWGVSTRVSHGFGSTGMESQIGELFESLDKRITVFFLGDHDPSGRAIEQDIHRRVQAAAGVEFRMERLAIHQGDIRRFKLPPQKVKVSDSRAAGFCREFGRDASTVELDALPAAELRRRIEEAISGLIDHDLWDHQTAVQEVEFRSITEIVQRVKNLPQVGGEL